jgi:uncharacterized protein
MCSWSRHTERRFCARFTCPLARGSVRLGTGNPVPQTPNETVPSENQADCGAGAFMANADNQGLLDYPDDIRDLAGSLASVGELEGPERTHGTIQERLSAFDRGFASGLFACNAYVPQAPIINP